MIFFVTDAGVEAEMAARTAEEVPYQWQAARDWERLKACLTRRDMFEALDANTSNEKMLAYWLVLELEAGADLERDYEAAWDAWTPEEEAQETGQLAFYLACFLRYAGRYRVFSESLARTAATITEKVGGAEHPDTGMRLNNLALLLAKKGHYAAAEPLYRRALANAEKAGDREKATRLLQNNAVMIRNAGEPGRALPDLQKALAIQQELQGDNSLEAASSMSALGQCPLMLEDKQGARKMFEACLLIRQEKLPADHPLIVLVKSRLAEISE